MSNIWNEELIERLYNEAYDELVADGRMKRKKKNMLKMLQSRVFRICRYER